MQQEHQKDTTASEKGSGASFFRRKKAIPFAVAKKLGSSKPSKSTASEGTAQASEKNEPDGSQPSLRVQQTEETNVAPHSSKDDEIRPISETALQQNDDTTQPKPVAFRRVKPKVSILPPATKSSKSTVKKSTTSEEPSFVEAPSSATLTEPLHGKNEGKVFLTDQELSEGRLAHPSTQMSTTVEGKVRETDLDEGQKNDATAESLDVCSTAEVIVRSRVMDEQVHPTNDTIKSLQTAQSITDTLEHQTLAKEQSSTPPELREGLCEPPTPSSHEKNYNLRPISRALQNDKENRLVATVTCSETSPAAPTEVGDSSHKLNSSNNCAANECKNANSQCPVIPTGVVTPVATGKTIKRAIKLGSLPHNLTKQLKSAIGIGRSAAKALRLNPNLTARTDEKNTQQAVQLSSHEVKVPPVDGAVVATVTDQGEVDRPCHLVENKTSQPVSVLSSCVNQLTGIVEESVDQTKKVPSNSSELSFSSDTLPAASIASMLPVPASDHPPNVVSSSSTRETKESIKVLPVSEVHPLPSCEQDSLESENSSNNCSSAAPTDSVSNSEQPTTIKSTKKIKKISFLTPLQQKLLVSSLTRMKSIKTRDTKGSAITKIISDGSRDDSAVGTESQTTGTPEQMATPVRSHDNCSTSSARPTVPFSTSTPIKIPMGFTSHEHKVQIISHVILPKLNIVSPIRAPAGPLPCASGDERNPTYVDSNPKSSSSPPTSLPTEQAPTAVLYDQYPKLFVIHSTTPLASQVLPSPSTSCAVPVSAQYEKGFVTDRDPQSASLSPLSFSTPEKVSEPPGLILTVLPRTTPPSSAAEYTSSYPGNSTAHAGQHHRIVPRIVIDKSFVEQDSQSSSSLSSGSSPERAVTTTSISVAGHSKTHNPQETTAVEAAPKIMGCSPNTRDKLRERVLKNLESQSKPPVVPYRIVRRVYPNKVKGIPMPPEQCEAERKSMLAGQVEPEMETRQNMTLEWQRGDISASSATTTQMETHVPGDGHPENLSRQRVQTSGDQAQPVQCVPSACVESAETWHAATVLDTTHELQRRTSCDFFGFTNSSIHSEQFECSKKIRAINLVLQAAERLQEAEKVYVDVSVSTLLPNQEHVEDRSSPHVIDCIDSDALGSVDSERQEDPNEKSVAAWIDQTIVEQETKCESPEVAKVFQPGPAPSIPREETLSAGTSFNSFPPEKNIVENSDANTANNIPMESVGDHMSESIERVTNNTHPIGRRTSEADPSEQRVSREPNTPEDTVGDVNVPRCEHRADDLEMPETCPVAQTMVTGSLRKKSNFSNADDARPGTSTSVNTTSKPVSEKHQTTGVDLIVAMAMSMKKIEADDEDDENSAVEPESDGEASHTVSVERAVSSQEAGLACAECSRAQSGGSSLATNQALRKKKRDELVELLLRHVNYDSLMGELREKQNTSKELPNNEYSDDGGCDIFDRLDQFMKSKESTNDATISIVEPSSLESSAQIVPTDQQTDVQVVDEGVESNDFKPEVQNLIIQPEEAQLSVHQDSVNMLQSNETNDAQSSKLVVASLEEKSEASPGGQEQRLEEKASQPVVDYHVSDQVDDSCNSSQSACDDHTVFQQAQSGSEHRSDVDEVAAQPTVICDMGDKREVIICPQYSSIQLASLNEDHASCREQASEVATPVATTICDIFNDGNVDNNIVSTNPPEGSSGCDTIETSVEEAKNTGSSIGRSPEPVAILLDALKMEGKSVDRTTSLVHDSVEPVERRKKGVKKGRKRSNRSLLVTRPAKRKKSLNLQDIKPSSPPLFDSTDAPMANEVVSYCSTDGFSVVDRNPAGQDCEKRFMDVEDQQTGSRRLRKAKGALPLAPESVVVPGIGSQIKTDNRAKSESADERAPKLPLQELASIEKKVKRTIGQQRFTPDSGAVDDSPVNVKSDAEDHSNLPIQTESNKESLSSSTPIRTKKEHVPLRHGKRSRSRKTRRSNSGSSSSRSNSNSSSSGGGSNREAADVSSDDSLRSRELVTRGTNRRKLKRKKRSDPRTGRGLEVVSAATTTASTATATAKTSTITKQRPVRSSTRRSKLSKTSKLSKASSTGAQFVISEVETADESGSLSSAPQRVLEVVNVRYQNVLQMAASKSVRTTRSSIVNTIKLGKLSEPSSAPKSAIVDDSQGSGDRAPRATSVEDNRTVIEESKQPKHHVRQSMSDDTVDETVTEYKCGSCGKTVPRAAWKEHFAQHNGVTFRENIDEPIDRNDIKAVGYAIHRYMKSHRRSEVSCEKCGEVKKSYMGMASHLRVCGLRKEQKESSKVTCEHCGRKMQIVSLPTHQAVHCRVLRERREREAAERDEAMPVATFTGASEDAMEQLTTSGRQKRKSVACAEKKIKKLAKENIEEPKELIRTVKGGNVSMGELQRWLTEIKETEQATCRSKACTFVGVSEQAMRNHTGGCPFAKSAAPIYECAVCLLQEPDRNTILKHVKEMHPNELLNSGLLSAASGSESDANVQISELGDSESEETMDGDGRGSEASALTMARGGKKAAAGRKRNQTPAGGTVAAKTGRTKKTSKKEESREDDIGLSNEASFLAEEGEVYKEMVQAESFGYRQQRANIQFTTIKWTFKFRRDHYCFPMLFEQLRPPDTDMCFLTLVALRDYLPKSNHSIRFRVRKVKLYDAPPLTDPADGWQRLGTFQGEVFGTQSMFYCGGPVMAVEWLPMPGDTEDAVHDQIVAVACKSKYGEYYTYAQMSEPDTWKCLIQIWNVGPLRNGSGMNPTAIRPPQLTFAIACDFGPIWQLAFCPSGCYNDVTAGDSFDRVGLLAATGADGDVYIFALSRQMVSVPTANHHHQPPHASVPPMPRIVHLQPVLRLSLTLQNRPTASTGAFSTSGPSLTGHSVMRIVWTRDKCHAVFTAGYSNGTVAVWKLTEANLRDSASSLLGGMKNGIRTLLPSHRLLHASGGSITALDIHYGQGSRFLAVTNADRRVKVYDLQSGHHQPVEVLNLQARSRIMAMRWLLHFPVLVFVYDDLFMADRCAYTVHQPREIGIRMQPLMVLGTEATDLAANEWISTNAITTDGGDVVCHKPIPFVTGLGTKNFGQILTTTTSCRINTSNAAPPTNLNSYSAFYENFGLLFSDTDEFSAESNRKSLKVKAFRRGNIAHYPAVRLNQLRWNPNSTSFLYYAIGYEAGFVRIRKMQV